MKKRIDKRYCATLYRVNISYLSRARFGVHPVLDKGVKRPVGACPALDALKRSVLQRLLVHQRPRGLQAYTVAWQTHGSNGLAHLDILLKYSARVKCSASSYRYLLELTPQDVQHFSTTQGAAPQLHLTGYSLSALKRAVLQYGTKQDPEPLSTFSEELSARTLALAAIKKDPYAYFQARMRQDPVNFDLADYVDQYDLAQHVPGWTALKAKLNDVRAARVARRQLAKPGIKPITRDLIEAKLSPEELLTFDRYSCFQTIVDHLNQIPRYGPHRPPKTKNLFISGPPDTGKTSLSTALAALVGCYNVNYQNKYLNRYSNGKYGFIIWNQTKFTDFTHTWVLQFLQGVQVPIPMRYNACKKSDNPLVLMNSNLPLEDHIAHRFGRPGLSASLLNTAIKNLGARITAVHLPPGTDLFFLQKLLVPKDSS